jgi:hypothetical protein
MGEIKNGSSLDQVSVNGFKGSAQEKGSKISARKNPRACEGFLTEPVD